ncbi:reverse transcriptase, partial [Hamiltosporidium magnivora]
MAVIFHFENRMDNLTIKIDLIENQICQGHFTPLNVIGESFEVIISTEDEGKYYLHNTSLPPNKETHFSFNTYEAQTILIYMKRKQIDNSHVPNNYVPRIELKFDSQFDTFNKEVAKGVRVEPAIAALTNLQKLLHDATIETEVVTNTLNMWIGNFNKLNSAGEILMCDVDVAMLYERLPPPPTFHDTTHQPSSSSCQTSPVYLVDTIPSFSGTDATACGPANSGTNLNRDAILEGNRLMVLLSILDSVTARMPRNGWPATLRYYNEKVGWTLDIDAFKKLAQNEAERKIRQEENTERRRIANFLTELCTMTDTTDQIKQISEKEIEKVMIRTRKLPSILVDSKVLDLINRIIGKYADYYENIESKISKLVLSNDLLEKARKQTKLSTSETKSLKKIMQEFNLNLSSVTDLSVALVKKNESLNVFEKKITMHESTFPGSILSGLSERVESEHVVSRDEIDDYLITFVSDNHPTKFPSLDEIVSIINWLPNWKAAVIDGIYNFFIEKLTTLNKYIYDIVKYLIPKGIPRRGSDYRPITCMSNLYKLTTKCVTKVVQIEVERRCLLAENQLEAVKGVQGVKEQTLLNIALNKEYGYNLKATWIDVKKAYDSIDYAYFTQCIENLNLPDWILKFIEVIISKWKIEISLGPEKIMNQKIQRGILQGDSFSPLLFVLCIDPLSRKLNEKYTKVTVQTDAESHSTNHLLFIDNLKLIAKDSSTLSAMTGEAKEFLEVIGLEIYKEKSATNDTCCEDTATLLEGVSVYKYLGIIEDSRGIPTSKSFEEVQTKLIARVERLCHTRL